MTAKLTINKPSHSQKPQRSGSYRSKYLSKHLKMTSPMRSNFSTTVISWNSQNWMYQSVRRRTFVGLNKQAFRHQGFSRVFRARKADCVRFWPMVCSHCQLNSHCYFIHIRLLGAFQLILARSAPQRNKMSTGIHKHSEFCFWLSKICWLCEASSSKDVPLRVLNRISPNYRIWISERKILKRNELLIAYADISIISDACLKLMMFIHKAGFRNF